MRRGQVSYDAPAGLSERSVALWQAIVPKRAKSPGRLAVLEEALHARDRADQLAVAISARGCKADLVRVEIEARTLFLRAMKVLGLEWDQVVDG